MTCPPPKPSARLLASIRPNGTGGHKIAARRFVSGIALFALALASFAMPIRAFAAGTAGAAVGADAADLGVRLEDRPLDLPWRARGVAFIDLPFGLRARYDAQALHRLSARDDLTAAFSGLPTGVGSHGTRLLESRFALSRVLAPRVELELSWAARSPLTMVDLLRIEDQRVAAMIRFVP